MAREGTLSGAKGTSPHPYCRAPARRAPVNGPSLRVVVVSDIWLLREGVALTVATGDRLEIAGTSDAIDAPALVAAQHPDMVLLDAGTVGGREMLRQLKELAPGVRVVVFAIANGEPDVLRWAEAGASGYVGRDGTVEDLVAAAEGAMKGEVFCSPTLTGLLFARVAQLAEVTVAGQTGSILTPREQEVMVLVEQGMPNKEIARRLGIGHATVKNHIHHILEKMNARGRGEAAARLRHLTDTAQHPAPGAKQHP
jgi:DNA-binding NarL/FixJ family response regulator